MFEDPLQKTGLVSTHFRERKGAKPDLSDKSYSPENTNNSFSIKGQNIWDNFRFILGIKTFYSEKETSY